MMSVALSVIGFLIILGPLVIVHEFGHYFFARLFKVKAEIFSIGFGPTLWKRQMGETELRLSAIPLGGYVKLLGEDRDSELSPAELKRALHKQDPWKRFLIFAGGPLFNFLFATLAFMAIFVYGEKQLPSRINRVVHGSVAERAGFRSGDQITAVDGQPVTRYEEVLLALNANIGKPMTFQVLHAGAPAGGAQGATQTIQVTPSTQLGFSVYGEQTQVGDIEGLLPYARSGEIGVSDPSSIAGKTGLKTGDEIVQLDGQKLNGWEDLEVFYQKLAPSRAFSLGLKGGAQVVLTKPAQSQGDLGADLGLYSSELFVEKTVTGSPAEKAGLQHGDRLVQVGTRRVQSFFELKDGVQKDGESTQGAHAGKIQLRWERAGKMTDAIITPTATEGKDPLLNKTVTYTVGVMPMLSPAEPEMIVDRTFNPFKLVYKGTERMFVMTARNFISIGKMFNGSVSSKTLGGPIMIGKIAGESLSRGLVAVLTTMGILSIGLGVLNILPIPVLDGGHLALLIVESVRRRPLTLKQMELVQGVGLVLILGLMFLVFKNDITRMTS